MSQPQPNVGYPAPVATTTAPAYTPMSTIAVTDSANNGGGKLSTAAAVGIAIAAVLVVILLITMIVLVRRCHRTQRNNAHSDALSRLDGSAPMEQPSIRFSEMFPRHGTEKGFSQLREPQMSSKGPRTSKASRSSRTTRNSAATTGPRKSAMKSSGLHQSSTEGADEKRDDAEEESYTF